MANTSTKPAIQNDLSSQWGGLSKHLIACFYEVERGGKEKRDWVAVKDGARVFAPLTEASLEMVLNWQSPFENAGADRGVPALSAMLQSGALQPWVDSNGKSSETLGKFEGRTGITRLNSVQVFSGMPPAKITGNLVFRAYLDAEKELESPIDQLMKWALIKELAPDGALKALIDAGINVAKGEKLSDAAAEGLLPSIAPVKIAMQFKGRLFSPFVIESIGYPLDSPITSDGRFQSMKLPITLCSLTAWDRNDWDNLKKSATKL